MEFLVNLHQYGDWGLLALRVAVGIIFIVHGLPKFLKPQMMAQGMKVPVAVPMVHGLVEVLGGLGMIIGLLVQPIAVIFGIIMVGAIVLKNTMMKTGFTAQQTTGWEFDFVLLAANICLFFLGGGNLALDAMLFAR